MSDETKKEATEEVTEDGVLKYHRQLVNARLEMTKKANAKTAEVISKQVTEAVAKQVEQMTETVSKQVAEAASAAVKEYMGEIIANVEKALEQAKTKPPKG